MRLINGRDTEVKTEVDLLRLIIEDAMWNASYHEQALLKASKRRTIAAALLVSCNCKFTLEEAELFYHNDEDEENLASVDDYLKHYIGSLFAISSYHERELQSANELLATSKILLARCNFPEISIAETQAKVDAKLARQMKKDT